MRALPHAAVAAAHHRKGTKLQKGHTATRTLPKTRPCVQRTRSPKVPRTMIMGPCNRTQEGRTSHTTWKNIRPHSGRTESAPRVHQRTRSKRLHTSIQESLCRPILLHQKERRTIMTSPRLQTFKQMDHMQSIPPPPHQRTHFTCPRSITIFQIRHTLGI